MKKIIFAAALAMLASPAKADPANGTANFPFSVKGSTSGFSGLVSLSTFCYPTAGDMIPASSSATFTVFVNESSTAAFRLGPTTAISATKGFYIAPSTGTIPIRLDGNSMSFIGSVGCVSVSQSSVPVSYVRGQYP